MNNNKLIAIIFLSLPLVCLGTEEKDREEKSDREMIENFKKRMALDKDQYSTNTLISKIAEKGYHRVVRPLLKGIPYIGKFFDEQAEHLKVSRSTLGKIKKVANEVKIANEHLKSISQESSRLQRKAKALSEAYKKANYIKLLLDISKNATKLDLNPSNYLPNTPHTREMKKNLKTVYSPEENLENRYKALTEMDSETFFHYTKQIELQVLQRKGNQLEEEGTMKAEKIKKLKMILETTKDEKTRNELIDKLEKERKKLDKSDQEVIKTLNDIKKLKEEIEEEAFNNASKTIMRGARHDVKNFYRQLYNEKKIKKSPKQLKKDEEKKKKKALSNIEKTKF